uniref:ATP-binding protein n=1 Tax=Butyricimonas faecalis TaxID=2093856 RepID=UPI003FEE0BF7
MCNFTYPVLGTRIDEVRNLIFNHFYRPSDKSQDNGLGLAIVKAVCENHGWKITYSYHDKLHGFVVTFR